MTGKDNKTATIGDVKQILEEDTNTILNGIDNMFENVATKDDLKNVATKDDVKGIKADLSTSVTRKEFEERLQQVTSH